MDNVVGAGFLRYIIVIIGYSLTFATSGLVVQHFIGSGKKENLHIDCKISKTKNTYDISAIIGKCENFLTITFILANAFTGLALIFTAKSIVRREDIKKNPKYYLGGTLINFSYSVIMGFFIRILLNNIDFILGAISRLTRSQI